MANRLTGNFKHASSILPITEFSDITISLVFKRLRVVRMVDARRNALVYLTYSDRVIEGSPQNSVPAVPVDAATRIPLR